VRGKQNKEQERKTNYWHCF